MLSVIVPAHNESSVLSKTLTLIAAQLTPEDELIVVADTCCDNSAEIASTFTPLVYCEQLGNAALARNLGAEKANKSVLAFVDADTSCGDNYFSVLRAAVLHGADYGCAPLRSESGHWLGEKVANSINQFNQRHCTFGGNSFVKANLFKQLQGFNTTLKKGEDTDLGERLSELSARFVWLDDSHIVHNERKFKEHGYVNYFSKLWLESALWQLRPSWYQSLVGVR
jgi:glycosyltransferase involved in cell wall biosynthesis